MLRLLLLVGIVSALGDILLKEITQLEELIHLQQQKLNRLKEIRAKNPENRVPSVLSSRNPSQSHKSCKATRQEALWIGS